jgi:hypothetical protein
MDVSVGFIFATGKGSGEGCINCSHGYISWISYFL